MERMAANPTARLKKVVSRGLTGLLWLLIGLATVVGFYFSNRIIDAPAVPDVISGHIVPFKNHGHVVFITQLDDRMMTCGPLFAFVLFAIGWLNQRVKKSLS
jgi:hypothetical protein